MTRSPNNRKKKREKSYWNRKEEMDSADKTKIYINKWETESSDMISAN